MDFTDLNKACPKDHCPLPSVDSQLTLPWVMHLFLFLIIGYHQILMDSENAEKKTFISNTGFFCYKVMPFETNDCEDNI